jgi:hemolysin D
MTDVNGDIVKAAPVAQRPAGRQRADLEFLPAALEIVETPASPLGRAVAVALALFFVIALTWAVFGHVDIVATAQGKVVPIGRTKVVQPFEPGTVTAIRVKDGDRVAQGQIIVELDPTVALAERSRIRLDLARTQLDIARLSALKAGLGRDGGYAGFAPPPEARPAEIERTHAAMRAQAEQQAAKIAALDRQIEQKRAEASAIATLIDKLKAGLPYVEEAADMRDKLMKLEFGNRIAYLDAQLKLSEQRHDLVVQRHRAEEVASAIRALEAQRQQTVAEYTRGIMGELAEAEPKAAQFAEDLIKAEKRLRDQTLRAPIDGTVQQLVLHTVGGVVTAAQALMVIVPVQEGIEIEAMVPNKDIGFVHEGDEAEIKIDTFNFTRYGLVHGKVIGVSHDAIVRDKSAAQTQADQQAGKLSRSSEPPGQELLYAARIAPSETKMRIDDRLVDLEPGMAVTVEIRTGRRRVIEYLMSPLLRYKQESWRER